MRSDVMRRDAPRALVGVQLQLEPLSLSGSENGVLKFHADRRKHFDSGMTWSFVSLAQFNEWCMRHPAPAKELREKFKDVFKDGRQPESEDDMYPSLVRTSL